MGSGQWTGDSGNFNCLSCEFSTVLEKGGWGEGPREVRLWVGQVGASWPSRGGSCSCSFRRLPCFNCYRSNNSDGNNHVTAEKHLIIRY